MIRLMYENSLAVKVKREKRFLREKENSLCLVVIVSGDIVILTMLMWFMMLKDRGGALAA